MILPTYTEDDILRELLNDFNAVKKKVRKIANTQLNKVKKSGGYIRENLYETYTIKTSSNNVWNIEIEYNQTNIIPWFFRACCIVESEKKTKDYYLVRGISTENPYFVKLTTHALKRVKERNNFEHYEDLNLPLLACLSFEHREIGIGVRYMDIKFLEMLVRMDDAEEIDNNSYLILVNRGVYYAQKTPHGNFIFKTYISTLMGLTEMNNTMSKKHSKWNTEGELLTYLLILHQYYNQWLYDKDLLNNLLYKFIKKDEELVRDNNSAIILLNR